MYTSTRYRDFLAANGVQQQLSAPHYQFQNWVAERFVRTATEAVTALLAEFHVNERFWLVALLHFVRVRNEVSGANRAHGYADDSLGDVHVLFCIGYHLVPRAHRSRYQYRARSACVYCGRSPAHQAHLFYDPATHRFVVARDARFCEVRAD